VAMEGLEADPFPPGLPHAQAAICRSTEEVAGGPLGVRGVEGQGRDSSIAWAHQKTQVHIRLHSS